MKFALGLWLALLLNKHLPFKAFLPRDRAAALDRADGAVGDRLLVDLRSAVLDHLLGAGRACCIMRTTYIDFLGTPWQCALRR